MANGHGGKRPGSGRPRKPLAEKILEGNPGKRKARVLDIPDCADIPAPETPEYLAHLDAAGIGNKIPKMQDTFKATAEWLGKTGCLHLVNPDLISEYALMKTRWLECEEIVSRILMYKDKNGNIAPNPMADMALKYSKAADEAWGRIWDIVQQNSAKLVTPTPDVMLGLLNFDREE